MSSIAVYGAEKKYLTKINNINENTPTNPDDLYSKNKLDIDICIKKFKVKQNKFFIYNFKNSKRF